MKLWKMLGLAGVAGVAATGALVVKSERKRHAYAPDEVRSQLHARFETIASQPTPGLNPAARGSRSRKLLKRLRFSRGG